MIHDSTWLGRMRGARRGRLSAQLGLPTACALLALMALAGLPAVASATNPDVRGEWAIVVKSGPNTIEGTFRVSQEANPSGEFTAQNLLFEGFLTGTFAAKLEAGKATVKMTTEPFGPVEESEFNSSTMTVEESPGHLAISGEGLVTFGHGAASPETVVAARIKTQQQIEEQEAQEKKEQEERTARANVRGEWSLTLEAGPEKLTGIALIAEPANAKNEFASQSALFEGFLGGTFTGTLKGEEASVTITTEGDAALSLPPGTFTSSTIAVSTSANPASMSGSGTFELGGAKVTGTLTATRLRTHQQIEEQEIQERQAKEKLEEEARIAKEKVEQEEKAKAELQAKEKKAREEAEKAVLPKSLPLPVVVPPLVPVQVGAKLTLSHSGMLTLELSNPGTAPEHGHLKLTLAKAGKAAGAKHTSSSSTLGEASFSIAVHGSEAVKVKLSKGARTQLTRHKTLRVLLTVTTQASGQPDTTRSYTITLRAPKAGHGKH